MLEQGVLSPVCAVGYCELGASLWIEMYVGVPRAERLRLHCRADDGEFLGAHRAGVGQGLELWCQCIVQVR